MIILSSIIIIVVVIIIIIIVIPLNQKHSNKLTKPEHSLNPIHPATWLFEPRAFAPERTWGLRDVEMSVQN